MLILQARKSKERLANILENDHICKLLKKSMNIISHFVTIKKNNLVDQFFVENGYKIFLQVIFPLLAFEKLDATEDAQEYI